MPGSKRSLPALLAEVRACRVCEPALPLGARPVVSVAPGARVLIVGQAPGTAVHASGVPWDDPSGDHLREWLALDRDTFYDPSRVAIVPMGFCYPGRETARGGGDLPPRPECAPLWHERLLAHLPDDLLIVLAGMYAQRYYLGRARKKTLGETVRAFEDYLPRHFALPHPSWRSRGWIKKNPWFAERVLPRLRAEIAERVSTT